MMNIKCCKDCKDRKVGCHGQCEKYITEKEENERKAKAHIDTKTFVTRPFLEV